MTQRSQRDCRPLSEEQAFHAVMEEKTSAFYLVEGLRVLNSLNKGTTFYPHAFGLCAQGFERLIKLVTVFAQRSVDGELPPKVTASHDLMLLLEDAIEHAERFDPRLTTKIRALISSDAVLQRTLESLTAFANKGRYVHLDGLLGRPGRDPAKVFRRVDDAVLDATSPSGDRTDSQLFGLWLIGRWEEYYRERNRAIIDRLHTLVAQLAGLLAKAMDTDGCGYLRVFVAERTYGRPPTRTHFSALTNSSELIQWEETTVSRLTQRPPRRSRLPT